MRAAVRINVVVLRSFMAESNPDKVSIQWIERYHATERMSTSLALRNCLSGGSPDPEIRDPSWALKIPGLPHLIE